MNEHDQHESTGLSDWQELLLAAGLGLFVSFTTGLIAGLLYSPMP
jgi:hypothetical protein